MEFYVLDANFNRQDLIEGYTSAIWTERFSKSGDFELVFTEEKYAAQPLVDEGAFIGEKDSICVGQIDSQNFKDGQVTVKGSFSEKFLKNRALRTSSDTGNNSWNIVNVPARHAMWFVMYYFCTVSGLAAGVPGMKFKEREAFDNLEVGLPSLYSGDTPSTFAVPFGNVYDGLVSLAEPNNIGWRFYPVPNATDYDLIYNAYFGTDRSRDQSAVPPVIISRDLGSLQNVEELHSIENYITTAHTFAPKIDPSAYSYDPNDIVGYAEAPGTSGFRNFDRRSLAVDYDDITPEDYHWWVSSSDNGILKAWDVLNQRAKDLIANNNIIRAVDGEVVASNQYKYGRDYFMGDIVTLKGFHNTYQDARVVEYIRTEDATGHKAYPTITVI